MFPNINEERLEHYYKLMRSEMDFEDFKNIYHKTTKEQYTHLIFD